MDEEQVDIRDAEALERLLHRIFLFVERRPELRREEDVFALHEALFQRAPESLANGLLIHVGIRRIDEAVARLDALVDRALGILRADHERAEAQ